MVRISYAPDAWRLLNGVFCVYKPAELSVYTIRRTVIGNLCRDLNELEQRKPTDYVSIEGDPAKSLSVQVLPNYADHPLVLGPHYQPKDVRCGWATYLGKEMSGVVLLGVNGGTKSVKNLHADRLLRSYHVKGKMGIATDNGFITGKVIKETSFHKANRRTLDKLTASIQSIYQKKRYEYMGIDMNSETAYELASKGLVRPSHLSPPLLYGIKCIYFEPPDFTLEVQCINETEEYFKLLIRDIGLHLYTHATCIQIQCVRYAYFTLEDALIRKHWTLENILNNMIKCNKVLEEHRRKEKTAWLQEVDSHT